MAKRITMKMVKAKNLDMESIKEIVGNRLEEFKDMCIEDDASEFYLVQIFGALFVDEVDANERIGILRHALDDLALTLFTPKAWKYCIEETKKEIKENCTFKKA